MKIASDFACAISASFTWYGRKTFLRAFGLGFLAHARPHVGVDRVGVRFTASAGSFVIEAASTPVLRAFAASPTP